MDTDEIIEQLGKTINAISKDVGRKPVSSEKVTALSRLVNSYNRLLREQMGRDGSHSGYGDPTYHENLMRE